MAAVICVECDGEIVVADSVMLGEIVECPDCAFELEVVSVSPLTLEPAPEVEEDWGE
jgi:alpha-aminoadipate carrier protein LysW